MSRFDFWKNTGGATATVTSDASGHTFSSKRIFQGKPGEQDAENNFYCGSKVCNPGPGSYDVHQEVGKYTSFGRSQRLMTASNMQFSKHHDPHVETQTIDNKERRNIIQATLGTKMYRYNLIKAKRKEQGRISAPDLEEFKLLRTQITQLLEAKKASEALIKKKAKTPAPVAVPFTTHGALPAHIKADKYDEAPRFYRSEADWDFGSQSRGRTINMAAFNYPNEFHNDLDSESLEDNRVMTGVKKPKSRCRRTDFFDLNAGERSVSPNAFSHDPALVPTSILKHHRTVDDAASVHSHGSWASQEFSERTLRKARRSSAKNRSGKSSQFRLTNRFDSSGRCIVGCSKDSDDMSEVSEITMNTNLGSTMGPRYLDSDFAKRQYNRDVKSRGKLGFPYIPTKSEHSNKAYPKRFTASTDDNFAANFEKAKPPSYRKKPLPLETDVSLLSPSPIELSRR